MSYHEDFMRAAIAEARNAAEHGEVPVGAVIIKDNAIIGIGRNRKEELNDPTRHAEMEAIRNACENIGGWRLNGSSIYVTAEPCLMCAGAILHARIDKVYFGVKEPKFGAVLSAANVFDNVAYNHRAEWFSGILSDEIEDMMKDFFKNIR